MNLTPPEIPGDARDRDMLPFWLIIAVSLLMIVLTLVSTIGAQKELRLLEEEKLASPSLDTIQDTVSLGLDSEDPWSFIFLLVLGVMAMIFFMGIVLLFAIAIRRLLGFPVIKSRWRHDAKWRLGDVELVAILFFIALLVGGPLIFGGGEQLDRPSRWAIYLVMQFAIAASIPLIAWMRQRNNSAEALGLRADKLGRNALIGVLAFVGFVPIGLGIARVQSPIFEWLGIRPVVQDSVRVIMESDSQFAILAMAFSAVIVAPIVEELFFRSFLQGMLRRYCGPTAAIFASALFFAAFHFNLNALLSLFVIGLFLGYIYDRTQSFIAPAIMHLCWNGASALMIIIFRSVGT